MNSSLYLSLLTLNYLLMCQLQNILNKNINIIKYFSLNISYNNFDCKNIFLSAHCLVIKIL